jgi:hypothetical protein
MTECSRSVKYIITPALRVAHLPQPLKKKKKRKLVQLAEWKAHQAHTFESASRINSSRIKTYFSLSLPMSSLSFQHNRAVSFYSLQGAFIFLVQRLLLTAVFAFLLRSFSCLTAPKAETVL